jgi:hypothetical protein
MIDGQCNDFDNPASGSVHYRFGQYMNYKAKLFSALFAINGNVYFLIGHIVLVPNDSLCNI